MVGLNWWSARPNVYATGHAERRIVRLADGSRVSLDAETELKVHLGRDARQLELVRGQARFDVAHDATRPFSVRAGDQTVIATGTAFNIDMLGPRVLVTLIQGRVEVVPTHTRPIEGLRRPTVLAAGQQLAVAPRAPPILLQADLSSATAWTNGQLVFTDEPLSSVVARLARYSDYPITVSPGAATLRVSGVFQTDDVDGFVRSITAYLPLRAERTADGGVLLDRRG
jgi:transmembrane sensor